MKIHNIYLVLVLLFLSISARGQDNQIPVTDKEYNDATTTFRFAIVSDRNGGMRPGIFRDAVHKLNLLQPEFVLSVGDLIDGYTEKPEVWNREWKEFDDMVNQLDMPFFYVPGNHDTSNQLLTKVWREKHGRDYYYFIHKNVLFIALNTEDLLDNKDGGISKKQSDYVIQALKDHPDVQWTLIFMHRPLWSYGDQAGYEKIEEKLKGRNYTVFSGHHHNYEYQKRNGMDHYILATTGGGSYMRGVQFGEFDQITWVTMKESGPKVAHIEFDHIYDKEIVTKENKSMVQALRMGEWLQTTPVILPEQATSNTTIPIIISNPSEYPMQIQGAFTDSLVSFEPMGVNIMVSPNSDTTLNLKAKWDHTTSIHALNEHAVEITMKATYNQKSGEKLSLPATKRIIFDAVNSLKTPEESIVVDADLNEWSDALFTTISNPVYMHEDWDWKGIEDGTFSFATQMDDRNLYVAMRATDQKQIISNTVTNLQDKFFVRIDPHAEEKRKTEYPNRLFGFEPVPDSFYYQIDVAQGETTDSPSIQLNTNKVQVKAAMRSDATSGIQILEFSIPRSSIEDVQGKNWTSIRLNFGWMDHDRPENTKPSVLWWRPIWGSEQDDPRMGIFLNNDNQ